MKTIRKPMNSIEDLQKVVGDLAEAVNRLQRMTAGPGLEVRDTPGGKTITLSSSLSGGKALWAEISSCSEVDYTDAQGNTTKRFVYGWYEVEKLGCGYTPPPVDSDDTSYAPWSQKEGGKSGTAYNSMEYREIQGTYVPIPTGTIVLVYNIPFHDEYWFWAIDAVVDIKYDRANDLLYHVREDGVKTSIMNGILVGNPNDPVVTLACTQGSQDTDGWSSVENGGQGLTIREITDIHYDTSTYVLSYRTREKRFDSRGRLVSVSGESPLISITTGEKCS